MIVQFWFVFIFINVLLIIVSLYLKSSVAKSSIFFNLETILIKEIFISYSKNVVTDKWSPRPQFVEDLCVCVLEGFGGYATLVIVAPTGYDGV